MTTQQQLVEREIAPQIGDSEEPPGVLLDQDDPRPHTGRTHTTVRVNNRYADGLDTLATQAFHDDRIETQTVKQLRQFANIAQDCAGPVIIVWSAWVEVAREVAEEIQQREIDGVEWQCGAVRSVKHDLRKARREGWRRRDFDADLSRANGEIGWTLAQSSNGLWHLCSNGRAECSNFRTEDAVATVTEVNLASVLADLRLCRSAKLRIERLVERYAHTRSAKFWYNNE